VSFDPRSGEREPVLLAVEYEFFDSIGITPQQPKGAAAKLTRQKITNLQSNRC